MAQEDIYARLEELGIDRDRFSRAMEAREDWGGMVHAFEWLTVLGVVLSHWPDAVPEPEPKPEPTRLAVHTPATDFQCSYAPAGMSRCPEAICDCFIDQYPDDPFGLHPEAFIVTGTAVKVDPEPEPLPEEESTVAIPWFTGNTAQPTTPQRPWPWP